MSRLDALEKAVVSLTKQAGLAYDLHGTGLENDPLGDADGDGRPNIMDSHPRSPIQAGMPLRKEPAAPYARVTLPSETNFGPANSMDAGSMRGMQGRDQQGGLGQQAQGINNAQLMETVTTLVLVQLLNNLQAMNSQVMSGQTAGGLGGSQGLNAGGSMQSSQPRSSQDYFDLLNDYGNLYNVYNKIYFIDDSNSVVDGGALLEDLVAKHNLPTSSQVSSWNYTKPQDYIELREYYRQLWDSYYLNVGTPPHFAQKR